MDSVRLDMRLHGPRMIRAECAAGALLAAALALAVLAVGIARWPPLWAGRLVLLALGFFFVGGLLNCLTLLAIACRYPVAPVTSDDPPLLRRVSLRMAGLILVPAGIPLVALRQARRRRAVHE